jgi:hypothetical protein
MISGGSLHSLTGDFDWRQLLFPVSGNYFS